MVGDKFNALNRVLPEAADTAHQTTSEPSSLNTEFTKSSLTSRLIDCLPPGVDRGCAKLAASYKAVELVIRLESGADVASEKVEHAVNGLADLERNLARYQARMDSLNEGFWKRANKYVQGALSLLSESSAIVAATIGASLASGGVAGVSASATANYPQVFGSTLLQKMKESDYDLTDPQSIKSALSNDEFMKYAKKAAHISAGKMTAAVFLAGAASGYAYSVAAKPVEQVGATAARNVSQILAVEASDKAVQAAGQGAASLARTGVDVAGKKAITSIPVEAFKTASEAAKLAAKGAADKVSLAGQVIVSEIAENGPRMRV